MVIGGLPSLEAPLSEDQFCREQIFVKFSSTTANSTTVQEKISRYMTSCWHLEVAVVFGCV